MNVLLISQCDKRALTETRRILDQFAERRGDRTWQTPITQDGLDTLRRLLRKTARKNTAVACHWIRGLDHSELLWTIGDGRRFNSQGAVPTNTTRRNILRREDENDWHFGEDISLLTMLAALLHDLGKACKAFQDMLNGNGPIERNQYRHEWVSLRLFEAFVGDDDDATWLARLAAPTAADDASWEGRLKRDGHVGGAILTLPFASLQHAPLAQAIGWLVVTHHRLPVLPRDADGKPGIFQIGMLQNVLSRMDANWNERVTSSEAGKIEPYWLFPHGLPVTTDLWRKRTARVAQRLLKLRAAPGKTEWLNNPYVMHLSRLCLMLSDHHYSSLTDKAERVAVPPPADPKKRLYANTNRTTGQPNQTLDEHLLGVALHSGEVTHALPRFDEHLPRLARHKSLSKRTVNERFRWQDKAADMAVAMRERSAQQGAFIVNMASTGCGKTLGNARVMYGLANPERGMRCAFAMGLRTLTLQTGKAFRELLKLGDDELAIRVGGSASRALFEHFENKAEDTGSASQQALIEEDGHVVFEGNQDAHPLLRRVMHDPQVRALLLAPVLVCTIDHLTPATESQRGGRQIAPMLRLMSGDLVLDEPDDFDIDDLPALTRLVHWAGLLGARVLLSSATLPPALVRGLFDAYLSGRSHFNHNRGERPGGVARASNVCCLWIDESQRPSQLDCADGNAFDEAHQEFANRRHRELGVATAVRRMALIPLPLGGLSADQQLPRFTQIALDNALELHRLHHSVDPTSGKRVSFGLLRMANIQPLYDVALQLYKLGAPAGVRIHLCVYHSQFPLFIRSVIETRLDAALNRRKENAVFDLPDIRQKLDAHDELDHLFIVLGSPVTEVGRDHDYDWALVEPSSMRSLIQLAGRVRRHRGGDCTAPNIRVFDTNLRHFKSPAKPAFCRPGFESEQFPLDSHSVQTLLTPAQRDVIDARPRIVSVPIDQLRPTSQLVDLEHVRMRHTLLKPSATAAKVTGRRPRGADPALAPARLNAASWWSLPPADALLTAVLPQQQPFRRDVIERVDLMLRPEEDSDDEYEMVLLMDAPRRGAPPVMLVIDKEKNHRLDDAEVCGPGIAPWGTSDYMQALTELSAEMDLTLPECARRFGTVTLPASRDGWRFHPSLGFAKAKS